MGSRMMHYLIGTQIAPKDRRFNFGNLAPDVSGPNRDFKAITHFMSLNEDGVTRTIHPEWFARKYQNDMQDEFVRGYYAHLLEDDLWLSMVFIPVIRTRTPEEQKKALVLYYQDFHTLNAMLVRDYQIKKPQLADSPIATKPITEIDGGNVKQIFTDLLTDFNDVENDLQILDYQLIKDYIAASVALVKTKLANN